MEFWYALTDGVVPAMVSKLGRTVPSHLIAHYPVHFPGDLILTPSRDLDRTWLFCCLSFWLFAWRSGGEMEGVVNSNLVTWGALSDGDRDKRKTCVMILQFCIIQVRDCLLGVEQNGCLQEPKQRSGNIVQDRQRDVESCTSLESTFCLPNQDRHHTSKYLKSWKWPQCLNFMPTLWKKNTVWFWAFSFLTSLVMPHFGCSSYTGVLHQCTVLLFEADADKSQ